MGEQILINSRKFGGRIAKSWQAELIEARDTLLIATGVFDVEIDHRKLGLIRRGTLSYEFYWLDRWYNVFRFHEPEGPLRNYYCNFATPPTLDNGVLDYVDLDIDILADAELNYEILDLDEFSDRTIELGYPTEILERSEPTLSELKDLIRNRQFPFDYEG